MIGKPIRAGAGQRKKKEPKKKESCGRGSLWKLPQPRKSSKDASQYFLDDFLRCLHYAELGIMQSVFSPATRRIMFRLSRDVTSRGGGLKTN